MDIHHLKIFAAVFRHRSFTRASAVLNISQPTISEHIKNLEAELNCSLFDRLGRSILPTRAAEGLYPRAAQILDALGKLREEMAAATVQVRGELVIGASTIPGTYILPRLAAAFKNKHPNISFTILIEDSRQITDKVLNHEILLGIVGARMESGSLEYQPLVEDEMVLAAPPGLVSQKTVQAADLLTMPFLLREEGSGTRRIMEGFLAAQQIEVGQLQIVAVLGSTASVKEAMRAGLGVSVLSRLAIVDDLASGQLVEIPIKGMRMRRDFYLIFHRKRTLPVLYQAFFESLRQACGGE